MMYIALDPGSKWTGVYIPELNIETEIDSFELLYSNKTLNKWKQFDNIFFIIENDGVGTSYYNSLLNWIEENFSNIRIFTYSCKDAMLNLFGNILTKNERKEQLEKIYGLPLNKNSRHSIDAKMGYYYYTKLQNKN